MRQHLMPPRVAGRRPVSALAVQVTAALVLLAFVPMAILGWLAVRSVATASRATAASAYTATASATAAALGAYAEAAAQNLAVLRDDISLAQRLDASLEPLLRRFVIEHPPFRRIAIVGADDRVLATSALVARPSALTRPRRTDGRRVATLTTVTDDDAGLPTTQLAIPVAAAPQATLVADLDPEYLWRTVHALDLPPDAHAIVTDRAGRVLAHSNPEQYVAVARGSMRDVRQERLSGRISHRTYVEQGIEWLSVAVPVPIADWMLIVEQPMQVIDQPALTAQRRLAAVLGLALVSATVALVFIQRTLTGPLQTLTHATRALAQGEPGPRVPVPRHRDLADLTRAFNFLVERREALEALVRRRERDSVIAQMGAGLLHDLAHPIRNIVNNARLLTKVPAETRHACLQLIDRESATIEELFANLKELTEERPALVQAVRVRPILRDIVARLRHEAEAHGVQLHALDADVAPIMTAPAALHRILRNLTVNAIEAAQLTQGTVTLLAEDADESLRITVRDTGSGMSPEQLASLFETLQSTKRKGLGLGLVTAKRLIEQLGGTLTATSSLGSGTSCCVTLPRVSTRPIDELSSRLTSSQKLA